LGGGLGRHGLPIPPPNNLQWVSPKKTKEKFYVYIR
jgi:hypothetical protein